VLVNLFTYLLIYLPPVLTSLSAIHCLRW